MRFRLAAELPLAVELDAGTYVLDLVQAGAAGGCYLRARALAEPVVFLLAEFRHPRAARTALAQGFEVDARAFPLRLFERLVADGAAEPVDPPVVPRVLERHHEVEIETGAILQLA